MSILHTETTKLPPVVGSSANGRRLQIGTDFVPNETLDRILNMSALRSRHTHTHARRRRKKKNYPSILSSSLAVRVRNIVHTKHAKYFTISTYPLSERRRTIFNSLFQSQIPCVFRVLLYCFFFFAQPE